MNPLNYASLEASKRLVSAGIVLETDYQWFHYKEETFGWDITRRIGSVIAEPYCIPAPSMAEVWRELPEGTSVHKGSELGKSERGITAAWCCIRKGDGAVTSPDIQRDNPTDALIDLLIWLKENKHDYDRPELHNR